ncbi:LptF/LptG family permease, partial [Candidatus Pelagibacter sp.]|nr:LptF/LptG family permease [Candidatus Pelagibacter sp.]
MKKLIFRKILKDILVFFIISLILLGIIVWTLQAINYFDLVMEDGHGMNTYFLFSILNFPKILHRIIPFVFFISLFYILITYEERNELNIFWLNGVSKTEFLNKIILLSIFLSIFQIFNGSYLTPKSQLEARNLLKNSNIDFFSSLIKEQKFITVIKGLTIFINKKNEDGSFKDIFLDDSSTANHRMILAKNGILIENNKQKLFKLYNGKVVNKDKDKFKVLEFSQIDFNLNDYESNTIIKPKIKEIDTLSLIKCLYLKEKFLSKIKFNCEKKIYIEIKQELLKRVFNPIYLILISIVSSLLITTS